jgi:hypothetical protein
MADDTATGPAEGAQEPEAPEVPAAPEAAAAPADATAPPASTPPAARSASSNGNRAGLAVLAVIVALLLLGGSFGVGFAAGRFTAHPRVDRRAWMQNGGLPGQGGPGARLRRAPGLGEQNQPNNSPGQRFRGPLGRNAPRGQNGPNDRPVPRTQAPPSSGEATRSGI